MSEELDFNRHATLDIVLYLFLIVLTILGAHWLVGLDANILAINEPLFSRMLAGNNWISYENMLLHGGSRVFKRALSCNHILSTFQ